MNRSAQHTFEPEEIMAYLDGQLGATEAASVAAHIERCTQCQAIAGQLWRISDRLLNFQVEPCPDLLSRKILEVSNAEHQSQIEPEPPKLKPIPRGPRGWVWVFTSISILVGLALLVIPKTFPTKPTPAQGARYQEGHGLGSAAKTPPNPQGVERLETTGVAGGLGDQALSSLSLNGQPLTDQQSQALPGGSGEVRAAMIVKTASMTILASDYDQASGAIARITTQHGGYVEDITANTQPGAARSISSVLRIPEAQLESFLADLRRLGHVEQETHHNQEITGPYVDLTARLRNARATEQRILNLLRTRTGNVGEVLQAEQELARLRGDIESMEGQRATMEHQLRYATVSLELNEEYRQKLNPQAFTTRTRIRNSLVAGFQNLEDSLLSVGTFLFAYGLSILFWLALAAGPFWFIWRRLRRPKD
jgi:Domain of unknown function (DUF4349)/Putative zinc-finger